MSFLLLVIKFNMMRSVTQILVPTDFSKGSQNALRHALTLADRLRVPIKVLHVVLPQTELMDVPVMTAQLTREQVESAKEVVKSHIDGTLTQVLQLINNPPNVTSEVVIGFPVGAILQAAELEDTTLIVMGSKGERGALERIFGSTTSGVVGKSKIDVMVIPEEAGHNQYKKVMYATDLSEADPFEIWRSVEMLKLNDAHLHVTHFYRNGDQKMANKMEELKGFFADRTPTLSIQFHNLPCDDLEDDMEEFIETYDIDLLVMYQKHRSFVERIFHHSRTKEMAYETEVPLLIIKGK
jgi:nucleotide-binding universal stress UspA family protein